MGALRLILAVAVVLEHTAYVGPRLMRGFEAVHIFFLISGFYMCMVLRRKYGCSGDGIKLFYINRFLRLYPTYFIVVCASVAWYGFCIWSTKGGGSPNAVMELRDLLTTVQFLGLQVLNFSLLGVDLPAWFNVLSGGVLELAGPTEGPIKGCGGYWLGYGLWVKPAWTIGCEIWFYLIAPLVLLSKPWARITCAGTLSAILSFLFASYFLYSGYFMWFFWFWCFALGMLGFLVYEIVGIDIRKYFGMQRWAPTLFIVSILSFFTIPYLLGMRVPQWLSPSMAGLTIPVLFEVSKSNTIDRILGEFSYPVYCTHMLAAEFNQTLIGLLKLNWDWLVWMNIGSTLGLSAACVFIIEKPFEKIRAEIAGKAVRKKS